jgi:hypothetical protein
LGILNLESRLHVIVDTVYPAFFKEISDDFGL